jgi:hypothetical protein
MISSTPSLSVAGSIFGLLPSLLKFFLREEKKEEAATNGHAVTENRE